MIAVLLLAGLSAVALLSWALTLAVLRFATSRQILDIPNERSSHTVARPRGGGFGFFIVFTLSVLLLFALHLLTHQDSLALACGIPVAAIGLLDDRVGLSSGLRLAVHIAAATLAVWCFHKIAPIHLGFALHLSSFVIEVCLVCGLVWMINLTNFMDGIDGIAGVEAITTAAMCGLLLLHQSGIDGIAILFLILASAVAGFLAWNWPPARIYMGDVGSSFLGFALGVMACLAIASRHLSIWAPLILYGVFFVDSTWTLLRRMLRAEQWYAAHRSHAFQHAAARWGHLRVTLCVAAINFFWLAPLAWLANASPAHGLELLLVSWMPLLALAWKLGGGSSWYADRADVPELSFQPEAMSVVSYNRATRYSSGP